MSTRLFLALALLVTCCTAQPPPQEEPAPQTHPDPGGPTYTGPRHPWPRNPCTIGTVVQALGWSVVIPDPCDPLWMDKGDPPPEATVTIPPPDELGPGVTVKLVRPELPASAVRR
jgi:hypothetical protein